MIRVPRWGRRGLDWARPGRSLVERTRRGAGIGTGLHLALGLVLVGLAGYAFVSITGHVFGSAGDASDVTALTSVYLLTNIIGPGLFVALEQEVSRSTSQRLATNRSALPAARRGALLGAAMSLFATAVLVGLWPSVLSRVLNDRIGLLVAVIVAVIGAGMVYWARGVFSGQQRFVAYAGTLHFEGGSRLLGSVLLLVLAVRAPTGYALVFAAGAIIASLAMAPTLRLGVPPATPDPTDRMARSLVLLVSSTLLMQLVANLGPIVVAYRLPEDAVVAGAFAATFVLARIPLFLFAPVQAMLLPSLTRSVARGDLHRFRRRVAKVLLVVAAFGVAGALLGATIGPWAVQVLLGAVQPPSPLTLVVLAAATSLMMVCQILQPALVAAGRQRQVLLAWVLGASVFLGVLVSPLEPVTAALAAQVAGPAVTACLAGSALAAVMRPQALGGTRACRSSP